MDPQTGDATEKLSRREIALIMCDELAALGLKPSLRLLRSKGLHGSDTDVQADVNYWYGKLLAQHTANSRADAIPTLLREQMLALWDAANSLAKEAFSEAETAIRSEAENKILKAQEAANLAEQQTAEHAKTIRSLEAQLKQSAELAQKTRDSLTSCEARLQNALQEVATNKHSVAALQLQLTTTTEQWRQQLESSQNSARALLEQAERSHANEQQRLLNEMQMSSERYRDLEKRSLSEVDNARQQLKKAEAENRATAKQLAQVTQRLEATIAKQATQQSELKAALATNRQLQKELTTERRRAEQKDRKQGKLDAANRKSKQ